MITDIQEYFSKGCGRCDRFDTPGCSAIQWHQGLVLLRKLCLKSDLVETVKWGHPCYMHSKKNIAVIGAFRNDFRLSFFNASLLKDPYNVLKKQGPNTQYPDMLAFTSTQDVEQQQATILGYLQEAIGYAKAGMKPPKVESKLILPEELTEVLSVDPQLADAFENLTPGRQKSYVINLNSAKKAETRISRISKFRDKIIAGKGATER